MGYRNLQECVADLQRRGMLLRIDEPLDPHLEVGALQRRVYQAGGPALLFTNAVGCTFPLLGNLFGTLERTRFIFRDTLDDIRRLVELKINPFSLLKNPLDAVKAPFAAYNLLPRSSSKAPVLECRTTLSSYSADCLLAEGWRRVPDAAAGVYGKSLPSRLCQNQIWACTGSRSPATGTSRTGRSGCITRSIAALAPIMPRPSPVATCCGSTSSWGERLP